ncbi:hypothetical protein JCM10213_008598 [Rhodosporidiobolus nylandii]
MAPVLSPASASTRSIASTSALSGLGDALAQLSVGETASAPPSAGAEARGMPQARAGAAKEGGEDAVHEHTPWLQGLGRVAGTQRRTGEELLDEEVKAFVAWARPTVAENTFRLQVFAVFQRIAMQLWPGAQVQLFGSCITGLYLPHGDFDVVVSHPPLHQLPKRQVLDTLANAVASTAFASASSISIIADAKVPLVKFTTVPRFGSFRFDVSFNGPKGPSGAAESQRLLGELSTRKDGAKDRCKELVMVLKAMLDSWCLNEVKNGGLGGMSSLCMAISYVQLDQRPLEAKSPGRDLLDFLHHYAYRFQYEQDAISTANGGSLLDKLTMKWSLPRDRGRLSIQHPVDSARDLSSGSYAWDSILQNLRTAHATLDGWLADDLRPPSALAQLGIRFEPEVLERRKRNLELYQPITAQEFGRQNAPFVQEDQALLRQMANGFRQPLPGTPYLPYPAAYSPSPPHPHSQDNLSTYSASAVPSPSGYSPSPSAHPPSRSSSISSQLASPYPSPPTAPPSEALSPSFLSPAPTTQLPNGYALPHSIPPFQPSFVSAPPSNGSSPPSFPSPSPLSYPAYSAYPHYASSASHLSPSSAFYPHLPPPISPVGPLPAQGGSYAAPTSPRTRYNALFPPLGG